MQSPSLHWQELQAASLAAATSETEFFKALSGAALELGFDYCAYGMRLPLPVSQPKMVMMNNYSASWQARYAEQNYIAVDPTVAHGMSSVMPLVWSDDVFVAAGPMWEDARAHGLRVGWAQSSFDAKGVGGLLTLARSHDELSPSELRDNTLKMTWLTSAAHEGLTRLLASQRAPELSVQLTQREVEVLRWTADGKTSSEVGEIMNISERTVNFHVNNAIEKMGTTNKTACVIKAAMLRLL